MNFEIINNKIDDQKPVKIIKYQTGQYFNL